MKDCSNEWLVDFPSPYDPPESFVRVARMLVKHPCMIETRKRFLEYIKRQPRAIKAKIKAEMENG